MNGTRKNRKTIIVADIGLMLVALFWGGGFVAGKFALQDMDPINIVAYRYGGAALIVACFCLRKFKQISPKMLFWAGMLGAVMALGNIFQTIGLQYTTPGKQSFIISLYTVLVPLLSWAILKTKPSRQIAIAAVIAVIGIGLLTLQDDLTIGIGDLLTFVGAVTFSLHVVFVGVYVKDMDATLFTFVEMAAAAVFSFVVVMITGHPANILDMGAIPMAGLIYLMAVNTAFGFLLQNTCQRYTSANHAAIILSVETVFGIIFAITLADEVFQGRMIVGCVLMFIAIFMVAVPVKQFAARHEK